MLVAIQAPTACNSLHETLRRPALARSAQMGFVQLRWHRNGHTGECIAGPPLEDVRRSRITGHDFRLLVLGKVDCVYRLQR